MLYSPVCSQLSKNGKFTNKYTILNPILKLASNKTTFLNDYNYLNNYNSVKSAGNCKGQD